ncbi:MAG: PH domain-containing protein [Acidimicrobiales bacterium]
MDGVMATSVVPGSSADTRSAGAQGRPSIVEGLRSLHPRQVQVWRVGWGLVAVAATALVLAAEIVAGLPEEPVLAWPTGVAAAVVGVAGLLGAWRLPRLAFDAWRYELAESTFELRRGVLVRRHSAIPYFRVQHIDITRSPIERALGLSQLVVRTAAATTDARLPGIAVADAELLRDVVLARTGRGDAV